MPIRLGPELCRDFDAGIRREWLVTNGLGGYASSTITGANSRRYHGLLVAALQPPVQRMVLLAALEERLTAEGDQSYGLSAQEYWDGTVYPDGFRALEVVEIDGVLPLFRWSAAGRTIEKRVWMEHGVNRTIVRYRLLDGPPMRLQLAPLFAHRDYHQQRHGQGAFDMAESPDGWMIDGEGVRCYLQVRPVTLVRSRPDWIWRILHREERNRGLDDEEDLFCPGVAEVALEAGEEVVVAAGTEPLPAIWEVDASLAAAEHRQAVLAGPDDDALAAQLVIASEQFRCARDLTAGSSGAPRRTVIAGYHWFTDWGRDTMISLPGLTLRPGTIWEARAILDTYLGYVDQGLIPNRFPDGAEAPEYNTMDATLWMFQALHAYLAASGDWRFIADRLDALAEIVAAHVHGTRHNIRVDPNDGLLGGGEGGYALTWMDARVGDLVVTPRQGKPVEINALWYNACRLMADWCARAQRPSGPYMQLAVQAQTSANQRFWDEGRGYLLDVVDGPLGDDPSLRPNQVMALGLAFPLIEADRARRVLEIVTAELLTPYGLRTLSPKDSRYQSSYGGDQRRRDGAYHMGIVWPWLMGPYLDAHERVFGDQGQRARLLEPFRDHLAEAGLGSISELFEPEPPYRPAGCIAQAWSVAEILRHTKALIPVRT